MPPRLAEGSMQSVELELGGLLACTFDVAGRASPFLAASESRFEQLARQTETE